MLPKSRAIDNVRPAIPFWYSTLVRALPGLVYIVRSEGSARSKDNDSPRICKNESGSIGRVMNDGSAIVLAL
jgi:hypothetical protein